MCFVEGRFQLNLNLRSYSQNLVDFDVGVPGDVQYWRLTGFYGYPTINDHSKSWQLLDTLCGNMAHSWLCIRDFNEILQANEQKGGNSRSNQQIESFRDIVEKCRFIDLGYSGNMYAWFTTKWGGIKVHLGHALAPSRMD